MASLTSLLILMVGVTVAVVLVLDAITVFKKIKHKWLAGSPGTAPCPWGTRSEPTPGHRQAPAPAPLQLNLSRELHSIDWFQFEKLVQLLYRKLGYTVEHRGGARPDGGIDLVVVKNNRHVAIQCKHWNHWRVNVRGIREFIGALTHAGITSGIFITLRGYTNEAAELASQHDIQILDEAKLLTLLEQVNARFDPDFRAALDKSEKFCPKCDARMVLRTTREGVNAGRKFWGCSTFPRCRFMLPRAA